MTAYPPLRLRLTPPPALKLRFLPAIGMPGPQGPAGPQGPQGPSGASGGAPVDAEYLVRATNATLTGERVVTDTATVTWDFTTPGQAKANATASGGAPVGAQYITSAVDATLTAERVLTNTATVTWDFSTAGQAKANAVGGGGTSVTIADTPPASPTQGNLWWESDTGNFYLSYTDPTPTTQWVGLAGPVVSSQYVQKAGDTMTDNLTISPASTAPQFILNKPSGTTGIANAILGRTNGVNRWVMNLGDAISESGSSAGSDFSLGPYNDAGTLVGTSIYVRRSDGRMSLGPNAGGTLAGSNAQITIRHNGWGMVAYSSTAVTNSAHVFLNSSGTAIGSIDTSTSGTTFTTTSDARLKTNETPFMRGREVLDQLAVVDFDWINGGSATGLVAQDAIDVWPQAVSPAQGSPGDEAFKPYGIDYSQYVPVLIEALQDAFRQIDELKALVKGK